MEKNQVSLTALMAAYIRAYHASYDAPKVFDDFLAYRFIPEGRRILIEQGLTRALNLNDVALPALDPNQMGAIARILQSMGASSVLGRSRYTEDSLEKAVKQGVKQYVMLGAGMDTFAFRCLELVTQLQLFEVDHPATQAFKRHRIDELGWEIPSQLQFVPVDFTQDDLGAMLIKSSFDPQIPSFFSWLGVTMYLTRDEVFTTLRAIAQVAPAGSMVIFDYLDIDPGQPTSDMRMSLAQKSGEKMKTGLNPSALAENLARLGLRLHQNLSPSDIEARYFKGRTDGYDANKHTYFACAVVA